MLEDLETPFDSPSKEILSTLSPSLRLSLSPRRSEQLSRRKSMLSSQESRMEFLYRNHNTPLLSGKELPHSKSCRESSESRL